MVKFLVFDSMRDAQERSRQLMEFGRKLGNPDGDGKPYGTTERCSLRMAEDGQAVLKIKDVSRLTADERRELVSTRPSKFDLPKGEDKWER